MGEGKNGGLQLEGIKVVKLKRCDFALKSGKHRSKIRTLLVDTV